VFRVLATLLLVRLLAQSAGIDMLASEACDTPCEESEEPGGCAPTCDDCLCCPHKRLVTLLPMPELAPVEGRPADFAPVLEPVAVAPVAEIMRVPKSAAVL
jgi:hypothetical protein